MPQFFFNKRLILLLISIILLVALIGFSIKGDRKITWPEQFVKDSTGVFQNIFHRPSQYFAGFFENMNEIKNTYEENKYLKSRLDQYAQLDSDLQDVKDENNKLREELGRQDSLRSYKPTPAVVIARNPDKWFEYITINKGSQAGIQQDSAVITSKGLVGKVKSVDQFTSTVQLLSAKDRKNLISAIVQGKDRKGSKVYGLIEGYDSKRKKLLLRHIGSDMKIEKGQDVVTSGTGGVFPKGLTIGKVSEVQPDSYGLTKMAYVEPSADFYDLENVSVAKRDVSTADAEALGKGDDNQ
ncbi:rod shape-determining protein MreC [Metabacillus sp. GX 13764]|uniref:rod shape-determining protein MreC n=1 Tax=Metabacillus kandeliae TaxID=2900151 RepID=UPI001E4500DD|nr:rod shape-determining protein MreC [Metabacillus kandeliae]MCD7032924.1 rod shape-determining protein MreC [Metabacillus kandeliae]